MRRFTFLFIFLFCTLGSFLWLARNFSTTWEPTLRNRLEVTAQKSLHARLEIDAISLGLFRHIQLHNVRLWDDSQPDAPVFRAAEIDLVLSLIDLPRALFRRRPIETIGRVSLQTPTLILSRPVIERHRSAGRSDQPLPLLFTLDWDDGTVQWKEDSAPHGAWTLYNSRGLFRIRGPKVDLSVKGGLEAAEQVRLQYGSLGQRWSGGATIQKGDIQSVVALAEKVMERPVLPKGYQAAGTFNAELRVGGRRLPTQNDRPVSFIQEAHWSSNNTRVTTPISTHPVVLNGSLNLDRDRLNTSHFQIVFGRNALSVSGNVTQLWETAQTDLKVEARNLDLALLASALGRAGSFEGHGNLRANIQGPLRQPDIFVHGEIPEGRFWGWEFQKAILNLRRLQERWELNENSAEMWGGRVALRGSITPVGNDLQITGENLLFEGAKFPRFFEGLQGRLNFSSTLRGPAADWRSSGSLWLTNYQWGPAQAPSVRGDFEITPTRFSAQAVSDDKQFRIAVAGTREEGQIRLDQLETRMPSGAILRGEATLVGKGPGAHLKGLFTANQVAIPRDTPFLHRWAPALKGLFAFDGKLSGTLQEPILDGTGTSTDLAAGDQSMAPAIASVHWQRGQTAETRFKVTPGVEGLWKIYNGPGAPWELTLDLKDAAAPVISTLIPPHIPMTGELSGHVFLRRHDDWSGDGLVTLTEGTLGAWPVTTSRVEFDLTRGLFNLKSAMARSAQADVDLRGKATWQPKSPNEAVEQVVLRLQGQAHAPGKNPLWEMPLEGSGELNPADHWQGKALIKSRTPLIRRKTVDSIQVTLVWDDKHFAWQEGRWGNRLTAEGEVRPGNDGSELTSRIQAKRVPLTDLSAWLWPTFKEKVGGLLSGSFSVTGLTKDLKADLSAHVEKLTWRSLEATSDLNGHWSKNGWEPLSVNGSLSSGGSFQFQGAWGVDGRARGLLKIADLALQPMTETFSLPKPLQGKAAATLAVSGPIDHLEFTGHFEGADLSYGAQNPLKVQSIAMDASLTPSHEPAGPWRFTITEGLAKTAEEQIRMRPGSFIELGGETSTRLQVAMDVRNLHLGLFTLFGGFDFTGQWLIRPQGFALKGEAYTRSLYINNYELEEGRVEGDYYNGVVRFTAPPKGPTLITGQLDFHQAPQLHFDDFFISGKNGVGLRVNGEIGPQLWNFRLVGHSLDIGTLSDLAGFTYPLNGTADLTVRGSGDLRYPHLEGTVDLKNGSALGLAFRTGAATFAWQDNRMTFTKLQLADPGRYSLTGAGVFPLTGASKKGDRAIDFSVRLENSNLGLLRSISPEVKSAKGPVQGILQVTGTAEDPILRGSFKVTDGDVVGAHYFKHLENFQLDAAFEGQDLVIRELRGRSGNGEIQISGRIPFGGLKPRAYDLRADIMTAKGLEVQVPELAIPESPLAKRFQFLTTASRADVRGHVTFKGPAEAPVFAGQAIFSNGHFTFPPSRKNPPPRGFTEWIRLVNWDLDLKFQDGAYFENELVEANLVGAIHIKGPSERLLVDGGTDINEGKISYLGIEFTINQARFDMRSQESGGTITNTPWVRGIAESQVQAVNTVTGLGIGDAGNRVQDRDTITLTIDYAPIDQIKPRLASRYNPNMPQDKLLARVTQTDTEHLTPQERNYLYQQQMVSLIDTSLATPLAKNILKRTGLVDNLRVNRVIDPSSAPTPETPGTPTAQNQTTVNLLANTKYTFEKNLNSRLSLGYGVRFIENTTPDNLQNKLDLINDVEVSYRWFKNVYLRGNYDLPTSNPSILPDRKVTIEPRWRFGWWGNTNKPKPKAAPAPESGTKQP